MSLDTQGKASYFFHFHRTSSFNWRRGEFPVLSADDWLHFGSIGSVISPGAEQILEFVQGTDASISFDINVRPSTMPDRERYGSVVSDLMEAVGRNSGVVKASDEDIAWLVGDAADPMIHARKWLQVYDLSLFIVTLGSEGAVAILPDGQTVQAPGFPVTVVDTVGAGDTFMAGFLSSYTKDPVALQDALHRGTASAAIVCGRQGAQPPTAAEVEQFLTRAGRP